MTSQRIYIIVRFKFNGCVTTIQHVCFINTIQKTVEFALSIISRCDNPQKSIYIALNGTSR